MQLIPHLFWGSAFQIIFFSCIVRAIPPLSEVYPNAGNASRSGIDQEGCSSLEPVENGNIVIKEYMGQPAAYATCNQNYSLIGSAILLLECVDGEWKFEINAVYPKCYMTCPSPPFIEHGDVNLEKKVEGVYISSGRYFDGTVATYSCKEGYILEPLPVSYYRICEKGQWSGTDAFCKRSEEVKCPFPTIIDNGYMKPNSPIEYPSVSVGREVTYKCLPGYTLVGFGKSKCTIHGVWLPEAPSCHKDKDYDDNDCSMPVIDSKIHPHVQLYSMSQNVAQIGCKDDYQNILNPCQNSKFYCKHGKWVGTYPRCVDAHKCVPPPTVPFAALTNYNYDMAIDSSGRPLYPLNTELRYECLKGYIMEGNPILRCRLDGCWTPVGIGPSCVVAKDRYYIELTNINTILITSATGAGVLGILFLACLVVGCRKRKALARAVVLSSQSAGAARHAPDVVNDHTVLLQHPDRLALIAFAEGVQNSQNNSLPTYDEATRDRGTLIQVSRLQIQRPHWPNLAVCRTNGRNRGSPNIDSGHHVTRHGSFASHTPSMRSGGESMGSTETVTISEGSTNVTLDTASSYSAVSQNPSCRGHCGSLASFDACSVGNTEGIPLLEESELEDIQGGANEIENPVSDNSSSKISTHSAPMLSN